MIENVKAFLMLSNPNRQTHFSRFQCLAKKAKIHIYAVLISVLFLSTPSIAYLGGSVMGKDFSATLNLRSLLLGQCTAVKVSEHFVLAAAHCNLYHGFDVGAEIYLMNYSGLEDESNSIHTRVRNIIMHPSFLARNGASPSGVADMNTYSDLAILEFDDLSKFGTAKISLTPIKSGEVVLVGGMGNKGHDSPQWPDLTGAIKSIHQVFTQIFTVGLIDSDGKTISFGAPGDSGGPVYRLNPKSHDWQVVGINSVGEVDINAFSEDPKTGSILSYYSKVIPNPELYISKVGLATNDDKFKVDEWLKKNLPADSFAE